MRFLCRAKVGVVGNGVVLATGIALAPSSTLSLGSSAATPPGLVALLRYLEHYKVYLGYFMFLSW